AHAAKPCPPSGDARNGSAAIASTIACRTGDRSATIVCCRRKLPDDYSHSRRSRNGADIAERDGQLARCPEQVRNTEDHHSPLRDPVEGGRVGRRQEKGPRRRPTRPPSTGSRRGE